MNGLRLFLERVLYAAGIVFVEYLALARTDDSGQVTDSLRTMISGEHPLVIETLVMLLLAFFVTLIVFHDAVRLSGKTIEIIKDPNNTDFRIVILSVLLGIWIAW